MASSLTSLLGEVGYISFNEVVKSIHKHIGLDKDVEQAEQILMYILDKYLDKNSYGNDEFTLYNQIDEVWQPIPANPYSDWANYTVISPYNFGSTKAEQLNFFNYNEILIEILRQRNEERKLPF